MIARVHLCDACTIGPGVISTLAAYSGPSLSIGCDGKDPTSLNVAVGSAHGNIALGFDASAAPHQYDILWTNASVEFYVDGTLQLTWGNATDVPQSPMDLYFFAYACGASWCGKFDCDKDCPAHAIINRITYTEVGALTVPCTNPPMPPSFCDKSYVASHWTPQTACANDGTLAFKSSLVLPGKSGVQLRAASTDAEGIVDGGGDECSNATQWGAQTQCPSVIQYGSVSVVIQTAAGVGSLNTTIQLGAVYLLYILPLLYRAHHLF